MKLPAQLAVLACIVSLATSCATSTTAPTAQAKPEEKPLTEEVLVGETTRAAIEAAPEWGAAEAESQPDPAASRALAAVPLGAEVTVFLPQ